MKKCAKILLISIIVLCSSLDGYSQKQVPDAPDSAYSLLLNLQVQLDATDAINEMYNFEFERSAQNFQYMKKQHGWHPLPYFLLGLNYYWRMIPYSASEKFDKEFLAYMDTSLVLSKRLYKGVNEIEGAFFLAATYAFKGRLYSDRKQWRKAASAGKNALKYLKKSKGHEDYSPELLFGDALFNYYSVWVDENYPLLKPVMAFFPKGDKDLGIQQLKTVATNAFYTRTEAQFFLMRILSNERQDLPRALQIAKYLHETFPRNAYFHRYYARLLYFTGRYKKASVESLEILDRIDSLATGYESQSGRYASFFLGHINDMKGNIEEALKYYQLCVDHSEYIGATKGGYYHYSLIHMGILAEASGDDDSAKRYYKKAIKNSKGKDDANKKAKEALKRLRKK
ncbi:MAG: tetratricopeptide repeat protein [Bacteroidota bacterium]